MAKNLAARLAMIAFATASLNGALDGVAVEATLKAALQALAMFYVLGLLVGEVARHLVEEHCERLLQDEFEQLKNTDQSAEEQEVPQAA